MTNKQRAGMPEPKKNLAERLSQMTPLQRAVFALQETKARLEALERRQAEPIAIIGMACRFPGATTPQDFYSLLREGGNAIKEVPPDRWDVDAFYDPDASVPGKMNTRWGGFIDDVDLFDNHFFGISAREARQLDPQHRIVLELAWEALEDAGLPPSSLRNSETGVFLGLSHSEYGITLSSDLEQTDAFVSTGTAHCIAANRISYLFDFHGPSLALDTACSSSLVSIHLACQSIRNGEATMALAGGVNLILSPLATINLTKAGFSAPDGRIRAFDSAARGYVRGEGAGMVVLKPLSAALADRDPIHAVIRGSAVNQNGGSNGLTAPSRRAQETALRSAYRHAALSPGEVQYVETQGTGTPLGDAIEALALGNVLREGRAENQKCAIGSVKTNIGHLEAASGMASLIKVVLSMQHRELPPSLNFQTPNPDIPFDQLPLKLQLQVEPWVTTSGPRLAGVSAFGFGGSNAHLVLEEAPSQESPVQEMPTQESSTQESSTQESPTPESPTPEPPGQVNPGTVACTDRKRYLLPLSARTEAALQALAQAYVGYLRDQPPGWQDICYTAANRRDHHDCRLALTADSSEQAAKLLEKYVEQTSTPEICVGRKPFDREPKVAFRLGHSAAIDPKLFQQLQRNVPGFTTATRELDATFRKVVGQSLNDAISDTTGSGTAGRTLAAGVALQIGLANWWRQLGVQPGLVLGHSAGELSAACLAGLLSLDDALCIAMAADGGWQEDPDVEYSQATLPFHSSTDGERRAAADLSADYWKTRLATEPDEHEDCPPSVTKQVDVSIDLEPEAVLAAFVENSPISRAGKAGEASPIAALYAAGSTLRWEQIIASEGRCVRLPTYPWQRQRHWVENSAWLSPSVEPEPVQKDQTSDQEQTAGGQRSDGELATTAGQPEKPVQGIEPKKPRPDMNTPYEPPRTRLEELMTQAWSDILAIEPVGIHDDFFELGGDSLQAATLLNRLALSLGSRINLPLRNVFQARTIAGLAEKIESAENRDDVERGISRISRSGELPLSFNQEALWFLDRLEPDRPTYALHLALNVRGPLDLAALEQSLNEVMRRHEVLRSTFPEVDGKPVQVIAPPEPRSLDVVDLSHLAETDLEAEVKRRIADEMRQPFHLERGPLSRVTLFRRNEQDYALVASTHHIVHDGWSMGLILTELGMLYQAFHQGRQPALPELPIQYVDFAAWQRDYLQGETLQELKEFWRQQLVDVPPLELPTDYPRPAIRSTRGSSRPCRLSRELSVAVREFSRRSGVTPFMTLLAAFQALLSRYSGQADFAVGAPVANRNQPETERLVGYFVNVTVLRADLSGEPSFKELVSRVQQTSLEAFQRQEMTLDQIVEAVKPTRDLSRNPLFQVMFALQNISLPPAPELGIEITPFDDSPAPPSSNFDLTLELFDREEGFEGSLNFSSDLFHPDTVDDMVRQYQVLLDAALRLPDEKTARLPLLSARQQQALSAVWNKTQRDYKADRLVHQLFEGQAEADPDAIALAHGERRWTYAELNRQANRLAHRLLEQDVGPGAVVGIYLERSPEAILSVLAVLKTGAAYAPIDADHTVQAQERIRGIVSEAGISCVVTSQELADRCPIERTQLIRIDGEETESVSVANPVVPVTGDSLAYVLYTSGSTGRPKGVKITHRSLLNAYYGWEEAYRLQTESSSHLQMASFGFDVFTGDLARALCSGAKLVLCPAGSLMAPDQLVELMRREQVDTAEFVPHVLRSLVQRLEETKELLDFMKLVVVGSDSWYAADHRRTQKVIGSDTRLINSYGLTEATIDSCYFEGNVDDLPASAVVPIGRPFANVQLHILDEQMQPTPARVPGELFIGGDGVAAGYVNPDLDADRFVADPFRSRDGARLLRTGDRARRRADGQVEFLGRADNQVKIRGYRIEPGEVEVALRRHPQLSQAAVVACQLNDGDLQLVGYIVPHEKPAPTIAELRRFLVQHVPAYMIPAAFVELPTLPMTDSGKLDRSALPRPSGERTELHGQYVAPTNETEQKLAEIWAEVLELEKVGIEDDFFDLGGHSLLALRLMARMRDAFPVELQLFHLFTYPTVAGVAQAIEALQAGKPIQLAASGGEINWDAETQLDPTIRVTDGLLRPAAEPKTALLTGATGFLGAFLLRELIAQTQLQIYCLVRARNEAQARDKIADNLELYGFGDLGSSPRVVPVCGDLSRPLLGLRPEDFQDLATTLDVIVHNAADVSLVYPYQVLKPTNVGGTVEILRLAALAKLKPLHYVSTLSVLESGAYAARDEVDEDMVPSEIGSLDSGYAQSKCVAERLVRVAAERGLPATIHRPGRISGDSRTGASNLSELTYLLMKLCINIGKVPDVEDAINLVPVDYVARAIVALSLDEKSIGKTSHLRNPKPVQLSEIFAATREYGYPLQTVGLLEWLAEAAEEGVRSEDETINALASLAMAQPAEDPATDSDQDQEQLYPNITSLKTEDALQRKSITCPVVDHGVLLKYLAFLVDKRFLEPPEVEDGPGKPAIAESVKLSRDG